MTKHLTRSIRLTAEEAQHLADLAAYAGTQESTLLHEWVIRGIRTSRIERAADTYDRGDADLRDAAAIAGLPIGVLVDELAERHIPLLRDPEVMRREIENLRTTFGNGRQPPAASVGTGTKGEAGATRRSQSRPRR